MTATLLFVQGAGAMRAPDGSGQLADYLARELRDECRVLAPEMPGAEEDPHYQPWRDRIETELAAIGDEGILVGHSLGASILVKALGEGMDPGPVIALHLVSTPWWGPEGWNYPEYAAPDDVAARLPRMPIFLYHSREDPVVEFAHLHLWASRIPSAVLRPIHGSQHSFTQGLPTLMADIRKGLKVQ